jgi:hypothetical protein
LRLKRLPPEPSVVADNEDRRRVGRYSAVGGGVVVTAGVLVGTEWATVAALGAGGVLAALAWWVVDRVWIA